MTLDLQNLPLHRARLVFPPLWVVYDHPADFPTGYVVRCWFGMTPELTGYRFDTLAQARDHIRDAGGCFPMARQPGDVAAVLESWL